MRCLVNDPRENRTPVTAVKGQSLNRLTIGPSGELIPKKKEVMYADSEGTRTPDLERDRLAFYATELRSHMVVGCLSKLSSVFPLCQLRLIRIVITIQQISCVGALGLEPKTARL